MTTNIVTDLPLDMSACPREEVGFVQHEARTLGGWGVLLKKKEARVAYLCKFTKTYEEHIVRLSQGLGRVLHN